MSNTDGNIVLLTRTSGIRFYILNSSIVYLYQMSGNNNHLYLLFKSLDVSEQVASALSSNGTSIGSNGVTKHITQANGIKIEETLAQTSLHSSQPKRLVMCNIVEILLILSYAHYVI